MPETRISAQTSPSTVDSSSEPMVTTIVSQTPCSRIGKNSTASLPETSASAQISASHRALGIRRLGLQAPFLEDLVDGAVGLELGERGVDLAEQLGVALADADPTVPTVTGL